VRYLLLLLCLIALTAAAPEIQWMNIKVASPWVLETEGSRAVLHVTITNTAPKADRLVRASTLMAEKVAIWDQLGKQGRGLTIPGRAEFVLGVDVPRIELIGLSTILRPNSNFGLLLVFEQAGKVRIDVAVVQTPGANP
jgi:copper(I)-binding protein